MTPAAAGLLITLVIQAMAVTCAIRYLTGHHHTGTGARLPLVCVTAALAACLMQPDAAPLTRLFTALMSGFMTLMTLTDAAVHRLPRPYTVTFWLTGLLRHCLPETGTVIPALLCSSLWFFLLLLLRQSLIALRGREMLGLGDVYLIAGVAAWSDVLITPRIVAAAALAAMVYGLLRPGVQRDAPLPFGPFLCASLYVFTFLPFSR